MLLIYCNKCGFRLSNEAALPYQSIPVDEMNPLCPPCSPAKQGQIATQATTAATIAAAVRARKSSAVRTAPAKPAPALPTPRRGMPIASAAPDSKASPFIMAGIGGGLACMILLAYQLGRSSSKPIVVAAESTPKPVVAASAPKEEDADARAWSSSSKPILEVPAAPPPKPVVTATPAAKAAEPVRFAQNSRAATAPVALSDASPQEKIAAPPPPPPEPTPAPMAAVAAPVANPPPAPPAAAPATPDTLVFAAPKSAEDLVLSPKEAYQKRLKAGLVKPEPPKPKGVLTDEDMAAPNLSEGKEVTLPLDLTQWEHYKGVWEVQDSEIVCVDSKVRGASLETKQSFGNFDIQFSFKYEGSRYLEFYFCNRARLVLFDRFDPNVWHEFKGYCRNGAVRATLDGKIQNIEIKGDPANGPVLFFWQGGVFRLKDFKVKTY